MFFVFCFYKQSFLITLLYTKSIKAQKELDTTSLWKKLGENVLGKNVNASVHTENYIGNASLFACTEFGLTLIDKTKDQL